MATNPAIAHVEKNNLVKTITWTLTTASPDGAWVKFNAFRDRCVSFTGTFGGATFKLMGSNDDGTTSFMLNDPTGTDITGTAAAMFQVMESPRLVRPQLSVVGVGATLTVIMVLARSN